MELFKFHFANKLKHSAPKCRFEVSHTPANLTRKLDTFNVGAYRNVAKCLPTPQSYFAASDRVDASNGLVADSTSNERVVTGSPGFIFQKLYCSSVSWAFSMLSANFDAVILIFHLFFLHK